MSVALALAVISAAGLLQPKGPKSRGGEKDTMAAAQDGRSRASRLKTPRCVCRCEKDGQVGKRGGKCSAHTSTKRLAEGRKNPAAPGHTPNNTVIKYGNIRTPGERMVDGAAAVAETEAETAHELAMSTPGLHVAAETPAQHLSSRFCIAFPGLIFTISIVISVIIILVQFPGFLFINKLVQPWHLQLWNDGGAAHARSPEHLCTTPAHLKLAHLV